MLLQALSLRTSPTHSDAGEEGLVQCVLQSVFGSKTLRKGGYSSRGWHLSEREVASSVAFQMVSEQT